MECHTPMAPARPDFDNALGKGGREFPGPWGVSVSRNITSSKTNGIGDWTDAEIKRAITQGKRKDGSKLKPPMGFAYYAKMTDADLDAVIAYLRTVPRRSRAVFRARGQASRGAGRSASLPRPSYCRGVRPISRSARPGDAPCLMRSTCLIAALLPSLAADRAAAASHGAAAQDRVVPPSAEALRLSYAPVVKRVAPAVVNVYAAKTRAEPQSADRRSVLPPVLRRRSSAGRASRCSARSAPASSSIRRPRRHQQPRHRGRRPGEGLARRQARVRRPRSCSRTRAPISRCCASRTGASASRCSSSAIPTSCRSATWCWRSAIRSASARP